mmetsp:Transcript_35106/g.111839  ORF Transcript_35106/g.111839 Transcript_35106/m.111839 type:complete len:354 (+) Transcript_35106:317-1378(+)
MPNSSNSSSSSSSSSGSCSCAAFLLSEPFLPSGGAPQSRSYSAAQRKASMATASRSLDKPNSRPSTTRSRNSTGPPPASKSSNLFSAIILLAAKISSSSTFSSMARAKALLNSSLFVDLSRRTMFLSTSSSSSSCSSGCSSPVLPFFLPLGFALTTSALSSWLCAFSATALTGSSSKARCFFLGFDAMLALCALSFSAKNSFCRCSSSAFAFASRSSFSFCSFFLRSCSRAFFSNSRHLSSVSTHFVNFSLASFFLEMWMTTFLFGPSRATSSSNFTSASSYSSLKVPWPGRSAKSPRRTEAARSIRAWSCLALSTVSLSKRTCTPTSMHCLRSSMSRCSSAITASRSSRALS